MNINDADQMRRLVCAFVVRMQQNQVFSRRAPYFEYMYGLSGLHAFLNVLLFHTQVEKARARLHICTHSSALRLLAYAIKTNVNCVSKSIECTE